MKVNKGIILALEEYKKELYHQYLIDIRTLDDTISLLKKQFMKNGDSYEEEKKAGRKPSEILLKLKADILNLILTRKEGVNKKIITSSLSPSDYKLSKIDFEKLVSKATGRLSDEGKLICIGGTSGAYWYLAEWIGSGQVKEGFAPHQKS